MSERLLIVDDDPAILNQLRWGLAEEYEVLCATTVEEARRHLQDSHPGVVTLDVALDTPGRPRDEGLDLLDEIVERHPGTKVIMVTGNTRRENALLALRRGAVDWYSKPIELTELRNILKRAFHIRAIESERDTVPARGRRLYHRLIGESESMQRLFSTIQRVAGTDATVLIQGDTGTGKELIAHAIHDASVRRDGPFVPVHLGAIPAGMLEVELFGNERGGDPQRLREGRLELASKGTVLLDDIAELPLPVQARLAQFLKDRRLERDGGRQARDVDVRVVAATPVDLATEAAAGRFRADLLERLGVVTIVVPSLRERGEDVRILAEYFLEAFGRNQPRRIKGFTQAALRAIQAHAWPGNVRELENRVHRSVVLCADGYVRAEDLGFESEAPPVAKTLQDARDEIEKTMVLDALVRNAGNVTRAARDIDVSRPTFHDLVRKHGIEVERYRKPGPTDVASEVDPAT
jgi:two-component system NtrC family response regulator